MELKKKGHEARETFSELAFDVRKHVLPAFSKEYKALLREAGSMDESRFTCFHKTKSCMSKNGL